MLKTRALLVIVACAFALACLMKSARSDDLAGVPCGALATIPDADKYVALTPEQWRFAEALFFLAPDTPSSLPPGDGARMILRPDGTASIVFVDGAMACAPIKIAPAAVEALLAVGRGDVLHAGPKL